MTSLIHPSSTVSKSVQIGENVKIHSHVKISGYTVIGKGNKERIVPFGKKAKNAMEQYLNERGDGWGSQSDLPLFMGTKKKRISNRTVQNRLKKYLLSISIF